MYKSEKQYGQYDPQQQAAQAHYTNYPSVTVSNIAPLNAQSFSGSNLMRLTSGGLVGNAGLVGLAGH